MQTRSTGRAVWPTLKRCGSALAVMLTCGAMHGALAQEWPARTVVIVVPTSPATGTDVIARQIGPVLTNLLGKSVVVENRPGASGNIGTDYAAAAKPDGYTLFLGSTSGVINQISNAPKSNLVRDFDPVAFGGVNAMALAVPIDFPARSVAELIALARARPGQLNYAGFAGGIVSFLGDMLRISNKIDIVMVPYKSTTDAQVDVLTGRVPIWVTTASAAMPFAKGGKVRILAVTGSKRLSTAPEIPTMREAGYPELSIDITFMFLAPKGTPQPVVARLNRDINTVSGTRDIVERLAAQGVEARTGSVDDVARDVQAQFALWEKIIATVNAKKS